MLALSTTQLLQSRAFINGQWQGALGSDSFTVVNPADNNALAEVAHCGEADAVEAINSAHQALAPWRALGAHSRCELLTRWHHLVLQHKQDLAAILTSEQGKPLPEALAEIDYAASFIRWFAEQGKRIGGEIITSPKTQQRMMVLQQSVGVVACITPWNFPAAMLTRKLAPALAAGCTVVCKPANETPLSANALVYLAQQAGFPAGVINLLCGDTQAIGSQLTRHPLINKISFTGSTAVGKLLLQQSASTVKRSSMELGGNAPFIVFDDADINAAVDGAINSKFRNAGQTCVSANRFLIQQDVYASFLEKFTAKVADLKVGDGAAPGTQIGPLIDTRAAQKVHRFMVNAIASGATLHYGSIADKQTSNLLAPCILTDYNTNTDEEIFGPVATLQTFATEAQALQLANASSSGLAAYFYTDNAARQWRFSEALEYGMVGINEGIISSVVAPFGGIKQSGHGREGSRHGLQDYSEIKYVCIGNIHQEQQGTQ